MNYQTDYPHLKIDYVLLMRNIFILFKVDFCIHCVDIPFNTHIFIQYITFCSIQIDSFNANILIQCGYIDSVQKYSFNADIFIQCGYIHSL